LKIDTGGFKILLFDIETAPHLTYNWGKYEQDALSFKKYGHMLCYSYKWLGEKKTHSVGLNTMSESKLVKSLYDLFNKADIIIAHNGDSFDVKMANQYFIKEGLKPNNNYKTIDTKKLAKQQFKFVSNKLDDLGDYLGIGRKLQTGGFDLWLGCMEGDKKSWSKMLKYNEQDVVLLEKVYLKLRPWCKHPNLNLISNKNRCEVCQGTLQPRGYQYNVRNRYHRYQCKECGHSQKGELVKFKVL